MKNLRATFLQVVFPKSVLREHLSSVCRKLLVHPAPEKDNTVTDTNLSGKNLSGTSSLQSRTNCLSVLRNLSMSKSVGR